MHTEQIFLGMGVENEFYSHDSPNDWAVCEGPAELSAYFVGAVVLLSSGGLDGDLGNRRAVLFPWTVLGTNVHSPCLFIKCFWILSLKDWAWLLHSWQLCFHVPLWNVMFVKIKFPEYHWKISWKFIVILALRHGLIWSEVVQGLWWKKQSMWWCEMALGNRSFFTLKSKTKQNTQTKNPLLTVPKKATNHSTKNKQQQQQNKQ